MNNKTYLLSMNRLIVLMLVSNIFVTAAESIINSTLDKGVPDITNDAMTYSNETMKVSASNIHFTTPWWMKWGRPYIKPEIGVIITPQPAIFIPSAVWTHILEVKLPCLESIIPVNGEISWTRTVNSLSYMIADITNSTSQNMTGFQLEHLATISNTQANIIKFLQGIKDHVKRIDEYEQYAYDALPHQCGVLDATFLRDEISSFDFSDEKSKLLKSMAEGIARRQYDDEENSQRITLTREELNNSAAKLSSIESTMVNLVNRMKSLEQMQAEHAARLVSHNNSEKLNTTGMSAAFQITSKMMNQDHLGRRRREIQTYANHVINQYINHANFTAIQGGNQEPINHHHRNDESTRTYNRENDGEFKSQYFDLSPNSRTVSTVPTINNFAAVTRPTMPTMSPTSSFTPSVRQTRTSDMKITLAKDLLTLLAKVQTPKPEWDQDRILFEITKYYEHIINDVLFLSSGTPFVVEPSQYGVVSLKLCYSWKKLNGDPDNYCMDRYVPNIKKRNRSCTGTPATDLQNDDGLIDNPLWSSDSPDISRLIKPATRVKWLGKESVDKIIDQVSGNRRVRRGLGDFMMENMWKPMFGSASEDDIMKITNFMNESSKSLTTLYENQNKMMSLQKNQSHQIYTIGAAISQISNDLDSAIRATSDDLASIGKNISEIKRIAEISQLLSTISAVQSYLHNSLTQLKFKLNDMSKSYDMLGSMIKKGYINPSFLSVDTLGTLLGSIKSFESNIYMMAPTWTKLSTMDDRSAEILSLGRSLLITLKIPMIYKTNEYYTYVLNKVPFLLGNRLLELEDDEAIYVVDKFHNKWSKLTTFEYQACYMNPGHICTHSYPLTSMKNPDCAMSIVHSDMMNAPNKLCNIKYLGKLDERNIFSRGFVSHSISDQQWVVSILKKDGLLSYESCESEKTRIATQTVTKLLKGVNVLLISEGCRVQIGSTTFSATANWRTDSYHKMILDDKLLIDTTGFNHLKIWKLSSLIPDIKKNATIFSFKTDKLVGKPRYIFKDKRTDLETLMSVIQNDSLNINDIGLEDPDIPVAPSFNYKSPETWSISHWQIWSFILGSIPTILVVLVIIWAVLKFIVRSPRASANVAFSALPTSFASANLGSEKLVRLDDIMPHNTTLIQTITNITQNATSSNITNATCHSLQHSDWSSSDIIMVTMMLIMTILSILHMISMVKQKDCVRKIMRATCTFPRNKSVTMYNVEEPVVMIFTAQVFTVFSRNPRYTTLALQVCTLPSPSSQWEVKEGNSVNVFCTRNTLTRFKKVLEIRVDWKNLCIISKMLPNMDTCQDMPPFIVIDRSEVDTGVDGGLPWDWYKIEQQSLLKIEIGHLGSSKMIYHYRKSFDNEFEEVDLRTPLTHNLKY